MFFVLIKSYLLGLVRLYLKDLNLLRCKKSLEKQVYVALNANIFTVLRCFATMRSLLLRDVNDFYQVNS